MASRGTVLSAGACCPLAPPLDHAINGRIECETDDVFASFRSAGARIATVTVRTVDLAAGAPLVQNLQVRSALAA